ncbi:hypothetical protein C1645_832099 [Glomus cerebriforme]|uniref:Uncharacterized protein n=1 Tax=Glomus cerebriforme TaxID=658196 RepID=A0A397SIS4_9GLOM|nr:hypothetical protein C1645_832099 [Glomus cerebriforme]
MVNIAFLTQYLIKGISIQPGDFYFYLAQSGEIYIAEILEVSLKKGRSYVRQEFISLEQEIKIIGRLYKNKPFDSQNFTPLYGENNETVGAFFIETYGF